MRGSGKALRAVRYRECFSDSIAASKISGGYSFYGSRRARLARGMSACRNSLPGIERIRAASGRVCGRGPGHRSRPRTAPQRPSSTDPAGTGEPQPVIAAAEILSGRRFPRLRRNGFSNLVDPRPAAVGDDLSAPTEMGLYSVGAP